MERRDVSATIPEPASTISREAGSSRVLPRVRQPTSRKLAMRSWMPKSTSCQPSKSRKNKRLSAPKPQPEQRSRGLATRRRRCRPSFQSFRNPRHQRAPGMPRSQVGQRRPQCHHHRRLAGPLRKTLSHHLYRSRLRPRAQTARRVLPYLLRPPSRVQRVARPPCPLRQFRYQRPMMTRRRWLQAAKSQQLRLPSHHRIRSVAKPAACGCPIAFPETRECLETSPTSFA